jgi:hypothetical protein
MSSGHLDTLRTIHESRWIAIRVTYSLIPHDIRNSPRLALVVNWFVSTNWFYFIQFIIYGDF